jgi:putative restriction endonuclease
LQIVVSNPFQELESFKKTKEYKTIEETTRDSVIKSRLGQGEYRRNLIEVWGGCSVTGCKTIEILRASHIKPWRFSSNSERLDPYNGLLLLPT